MEEVESGVTEKEQGEDLNSSMGQPCSLSHMGVSATQLRNEQKIRM